MSRRLLGIPRQHVVSMIALFWTFGFSRAGPPINSVLYPLFHFFYCIFLRAFLLLAFVASFASLSKETWKRFCTGDFVSRQQLFFFKASFGTCSFAVAAPFVAFCWFFGFGFSFVWVRACVFSGLLVFYPLRFLCVGLGLCLWVRNGYKKDCFNLPG